MDERNDYNSIAQDFSKEFNIKCAKFLKFKTNSEKSHWKYRYDDNSFLANSIKDLHGGWLIEKLKFDSDWNWIHETIDKILVTEDPINKSGDTTFSSYKQDIKYSLYKKEHVLSSINNFLDWYNKI